jgi:hypothetical protein
VFINVVSDLTRLGGFFHAAVRTAAAAAAARPPLWANKRGKSRRKSTRHSLYQISRRRDAFIDLTHIRPRHTHTSGIISFHFLRISENVIWRENFCVCICMYQCAYCLAYLFISIFSIELDVWKSIRFGWGRYLTYCAPCLITQ